MVSADTIWVVLLIIGQPYVECVEFPTPNDTSTQIVSADTTWVGGGHTNTIRIAARWDAGDATWWQSLY
jgi:hypothetical protein